MLRRFEYAKVAICIPDNQDVMVGITNNININF